MLIYIFFLKLQFYFDIFQYFLLIEYNYYFFSIFVSWFFFRRNNLFCLCFIFLIIFLCNLFFFENDFNVLLFSGALATHPWWIVVNFTILLFILNSHYVFYFFSQKENISYKKKVFLLLIIVSSINIICGTLWALQELIWVSWWTWDFIEVSNFTALSLFVLHYHTDFQYFSYFFFFKFFAAMLLLARFDIFESIHNFIEVQSLTENILIFFFLYKHIIILFSIFLFFFLAKTLASIFFPRNFNLFFFLLSIVDMSIFELLYFFMFLKKNIIHIFFFIIIFWIIVFDYVSFIIPNFIFFWKNYFFDVEFLKETLNNLFEVIQLYEIFLLNKEIIKFKFNKFIIFEDLSFFLFMNYYIILVGFYCLLRNLRCNFVIF